jgi:hypothetical protein
MFSRFGTNIGLKDASLSRGNLYFHFPVTGLDTLFAEPIAAVIRLPFPVFFIAEMVSQLAFEHFLYCPFLYAA